MAHIEARVNEAAAAPSPTQQARGWCFTINNPSAAEKTLFPDGLTAGVDYCVYQIERGEQGTEHVQGFVYLSKKKNFNFIRKIVWHNAEDTPVYGFARAHLTQARGTPAQNKTYCTKIDTRIDGPWELGECPVQTKGKRTDLDDACDIALSGRPLTEIAPATYTRYHRGIRALIELHRKPQNRFDTKVICIIGKTGVGKSYFAHTCYPNLFTPYYGNGGIWFDGYEGEEVILLDEFRGQIPLQKLLQTLDVYKYRAETKGGSIAARWKLVIVCSNTHPSDWYTDKPGATTRDAEREALARRLGIGTTRFIEASTREELLQKLPLAVFIDGIVPPEPQPWLRPPLAPPAPAAPADDEDLAPPPPKRQTLAGLLASIADQP